MLAEVIPFPRCAIVREIGPHNVPAHWTGWHEYLYEHFQRCDKNTPREAFERVEQEIVDRCAADSLPPGEDQLLFLARLAFGRLRVSSDVLSG
ncbi:hypothetical protein [Dyella jiangningensis]|uniref:hypothetical protein n=1 Tax=Dyella jiangningensis TaxID=1379159 RepID=UPI0011BEB2B0|nr:hypothetical protein [Dyella jiangningensis]